MVLIFFFFHRKAILHYGVKKADAIIREKAGFEIGLLVVIVAVVGDLVGVGVNFSCFLCLIFLLQFTTTSPPPPTPPPPPLPHHHHHQQQQQLPGDLQPARAAKNCHLPVLMVHGKDDTFILPKHSEKCFHEYAGEKKRIIMVCLWCCCVWLCASPSIHEKFFPFLTPLLPSFFPQVAGAHDGERPQWGQDHIYVFLQHLLIAGTSIPNNNNQQQQQQQNSILPLSLGEMWKERGNGEVKQGKWEEASEWYIKAVDYLVGEVKEGREESRRGEEVVEGEGEGMMKRWFGGLFCGQPRVGFFFYLFDCFFFFVLFCFLPSLKNSRTPHPAPPKKQQKQTNY